MAGEPQVVEITCPACGEVFDAEYRPKVKEDTRDARIAELIAENETLRQSLSDAAARGGGSAGSDDGDDGDDEDDDGDGDDAEDDEDGGWI